MRQPAVTLEEATRLLKMHSGTLADIQLKMLDYLEHLYALEFVIFYLDSRARKMFEGQLAVEHKEKLKLRQELELLLHVAQAEFPGKPN